MSSPRINFLQWLAAMPPETRCDVFQAEDDCALLFLFSLIAYIEQYIDDKAFKRILAGNSKATQRLRQHYGGNEIIDLEQVFADQDGGDDASPWDHKSLKLKPKQE
jgi:hypothetical protein